MQKAAEMNVVRLQRRDCQITMVRNSGEDEHRNEKQAFLFQGNLERQRRVGSPQEEDSRKEAVCFATQISLQLIKC